MRIANILFFGTCLLALQWTASVKAFFNITSDLLRTNQTFNVTIKDSCNAAYTVDFGDGTTKSLTNSEKVVSHSYGSPRSYNIVVQSGSAPVGCKRAEKTVDVRDAIQNVTTTVSSNLCRVGQTLNISAQVIPETDVTVFWRLNRTTNWTEGPVECKELGTNDLYVMVENGVSVVSSECYDQIFVIDFNFTFNPEIGPSNSTVEFTRSDVTEGPVASNNTYTFVWEFVENETMNCENKTVSKFFPTSNPDPGYVVQLWVYNQDGEAAYLEKNIKIYDAIEKPIQVSYPNMTRLNGLTEFVVAPHKGHGVTYTWDYGDNSTLQNTTSRNITYMYSSSGEHCVVLVARNFFSEAVVSFKISVVSAIDGFGFVKNITPVETGFPTNIGIEVRNGSNVNVSINFGDGSAPMWIVNIDDVLDIFVISLWHNYSTAGLYNVTIMAWNPLNSMTARGIAEVQDPVRNLTIQKKYDTECLEVNGTLSVLLDVIGTDPQYFYDFGDQTNRTLSESIANHSYVTHGEFVLNMTAFNKVSSVQKTCKVTVCKPVVSLLGLVVSSPPTNLSNPGLSDPVEFTMTLTEGSDFECLFNYGDGSFDFFAKNCYNLTYFADGVTTDKTPFMNLEFKVNHNFTDVGRYQVYVNCSNRLSNISYTTIAVVQKPIEELILISMPPKILGQNNPISWTMVNGTNVTFHLEAEGTLINYSSMKTDTGHVFVTTLSHISSPGVYLVKLRAQNEVSEANRSIILIIQDDVTEVLVQTWTTTSDFGSNIRGFGPKNNTFPSEYAVNFTATPDKGTNLSYWWKFDDGDEHNDSEPTTTHKFAEIEAEYWTNVTVFNLVSSVTKLFRVKIENSVLGLTIADDSPVKVNRTTTFSLGLTRFGTRTCIKMDMGDDEGLFVFGGSHCQSLAPGYTYKSTADDVTSITHFYKYSTINEFWTTINTSNTVSRLSLEFKSVTVALSCFYPNATMLGVGQNATTATEKKRSEPLIITNDIEIDCEASKSTAFKWEVYKISSDKVTFKALPNDIPVQLAVSNQAELYVRPTGLDFGFYKCVFTVWMEGVEGVSGEAVGYIHVVPTSDSLQPFVDGGLSKRYKFGRNITLNAGKSKDIDFEVLSEASPTFTWLCRNFSEPEFNTSGNLIDIPLITIPELDSVQNITENQGGCFKTGKGRLDIKDSTIFIDSRRGMQENATYVITLVVDTKNPFWSNRDVYHQRWEITYGDPPEVEVSCTPLCPPKVNIDQKLPLQGTCKVCFGELTFSWFLYQHRHLNVNPIDIEKMDEVKNLAAMSTTGIHSLNLALKQNMLPRDTGFTAFFRAYRQNGQFGEYVHTFVTNSPPENGTCDVQPRMGYAMNTSFTINCTNWADPDEPLSYEFLYINYVQESAFFVSHETSASVFLPMGHEANDFNLTLKMRVLDHIGAATTETIVIKVKPSNYTNDQLKDMITGEDGALKEALKTGDLQKMVEIVNSVGSILNYIGRQAEKAEQGNLTEAQAAESKEAEDTRLELRTEIIKDLSEFEMATVGHIKLIASAIDVTTEVNSEVETKAQELALHSFKEMVSVLNTESSVNNVGFMAVKDTVNSALGGIANVLQSSATLAAVDNADSQENITGYTGNSSFGGVVSVKDRARNRTLKLLGIVDDLGHIVLNNIVAGEPAVTIQTRDFNLTVEKTLLEQLGDSVITDGHTKFTLPTLEEMGLKYNDNGTEKYSSIEIQMNAIPTNLHTWSNTSNEVNSYSVGLTLKDESRHPLNTSNFSSDANIYIPRNASQLPDEEEFFVVPMGDNKYIQYHAIQVNSSNFSVHIQIRAVNESIGNLTVFLLFDERPTPEHFDYNWTIPDFSGCTFRNVSRVVSNSSVEGSGANNATNSSATNSTETENQVVVQDVERDCLKHPNIVSISNSMVTQKGTYYLGVYYEKPEPETEEESATSSGPTEARKRRDIPVDCIKRNGRMKRSCVIIPAPPPKPTTPSKQQYGTKAANVDFSGNTFNPNDTEHYFLRVFSSNCLFWDEENENWINKGCKVGDHTNPDLIHCKCNHLTSFSSDFIVAPNPIDFDKVFSADLSKNFVVLLVVCLLFGLYLLLVVIARRFDKRDLDKLGATAVRNRAEASFSYLISIHTGVRQNAGTTSSVYIVLSGDEWESTPMPLADPDRKVFQRGQENNFVVTLPRSLGKLTHIRIWHDNYGSNASWYLSRVSVDDLRTEERWYFICERWLAVEEDDGKVERILPVASEQELTHFQHLFVSKTVRELGDGHLWFSVVTRPANSPFTRVQRVSCCLSLLCCTMVTNAMFYQIGGGGETTTMIQIGSYEFDLRGFIIGIQASLIVFPVNFALVQIFRNVRPKEVKRQRDIGTTEKQDEDFADISRCSSLEGLQNASSEAQIIEKEPEDNRKKEPSTEKKKKKGLPHGFVYVAWILCFLASVASAVFTVFYSLSWGPEIANKWLIAFVTSFFQSILIIQPLKVVLAALLFAIIVKKPMDAADDTSDKKELKASPDGQETGDDILLDYDENDERYRPPDEDFLKAARAHRLKEVRMSEILKEICTYFVFLTLLLLAAYGNRDPNMYLLRKTLHETFVDLDQLSVDLGDATDVDLFWHWGRETLVPNLYPGVLYNNKSDKYKGFIDDRYNYLVGISRLRQARVEENSCEITKEFQPYFNNCYSAYSFINEENKDYDIGWKFLNKSATTTSRRKRSVEEQFAFRKEDELLQAFGDSSRIRSRRAVEPVYTSTSGRQTRKKKRPGNTAKNYYVLDSAVLPDGSIISCPSRWIHNSALELRGYPFWGKMTIYSGGGYPANLGYDYATALTVIADLHSHSWVDQQTRAVFVEFTVYNANTNLFGIAFLFVEFLPTGGAFPYAHFVVSRVYSYVGHFGNFILACQIFLILFMLYFMYREGKAIYKQRKAYFNGFFNWMEVIMIACELTMVVLFLGRLWEVDKNLMELRYNPKDFVSFQYAGAADEALSFIMGILVFFVTLRFLKLFRFNKRMTLMGSTIRECARPLGSFCISFMIVFLAYAIFAFLVFGLDNDRYKNFLTAFETQTSILLGDFDYDELQRTNRLLGPIYFFTFMYFSVFYLMNMFLAIINDTFSEVKSSNDKQQNEYEMVEFILSRFKENLGLNRNRVAASKSPFRNPSSGFPSSPPFLPSDYKHREEDVLSACSQLEFENKLKSRTATAQNVLRKLSVLDKRVDELTTLVEENEKHEANSDQKLYDIINDMKNDKVEV